MTRLEEPVFSPALSFLAEVEGKDPILAEQVKIVLKRRAEGLLKSKEKAAVMQAHVSLADFLARVPKQQDAREFAELVLRTTREGFASDYSKELKLVAAAALHQYWIALARFDTTQAKLPC
jgi:hypothetical protein